MYDRHVVAPALALLAALAGCIGNTSETALDPQEYLARALDLMQAQSLGRDSLDWPQIRAEAMRRAAGAQTVEGTHDAIRAALAELGDGHSFFLPARQPWAARVLGALNPRAAPEGRRVSARVGYVSVPGFGGANPHEFAQAITGAMASADGPQVCGWIVDVRGNGGGNMWPMLAGLAPLLGDGPFGYFVSHDSARAKWEIPGAAALRATAGLEHPRPAVAVLQGPRTTSSGEAVVVAFRGRPDVRTFGQPTRGLSTSNVTNVLADGSRLNVTNAVFADRTGRLYGGTIPPDQETPASMPEEQLVRVAAAWLEQQPACLRTGT